jgi:hypothetical protein
MGRQDVGKALEALQDDAIRAQVTAGDLSSLESRTRLTEDERKLVKAAAEDYPEVQPFVFSFNSFERDFASRIDINTASMYHVAGLYSIGREIPSPRAQ